MKRSPLFRVLFVLKCTLGIMYMVLSREEKEAVLWGCFMLTS